MAATSLSFKAPSVKRSTVYNTSQQSKPPEGPLQPSGQSTEQRLVNSGLSSSAAQKAAARNAGSSLFHASVIQQIKE